MLGGCSAIEKSALDAGTTVELPFVPGRMDTTQEMTDMESFDYVKNRKTFNILKWEIDILATLLFRHTLRFYTITIALGINICEFCTEK